MRRVAERERERERESFLVTMTENDTERAF